MSKWIEFHKVDPPIIGRKTDTFLIFTKTGDETVLGEIKWYGPWRQYAFFPQPNCLFEKTCLQDITDFLKKLMDERKIEKAKGLRPDGGSSVSGHASESR